MAVEPTVAPAPPEPTVPAYDLARVQRRTLALLFSTQVVGGVGVAIGLAVGALLAADMAGVSLSGVAQSAAVVGSALLAVPVVRIMRQYGRRPGMLAAYAAAALGGLGVVAAAVLGSVPLLFAGLFLFGGGTTANMQARYAAVDLAPAARRGQHLSLVVWATTVGAVAGPNLAPLAGTALGGIRLGGRDVPTLAAPFAFSIVLFGAAALVLGLLLRPDPLLVARGRAGAPEPGDQRRLGMRAGLAAVAARPAARLGVAAMAVGHVVMVGVMAMTPVHILGAGHDAAHTLRIVGVVLSLHIAGMFAFALVTGWLTDRLGRRPVILGGVALLLAACAVAGTAGHHSGQLSIGLFLLGLGWSATMVAGSTLLSESVPEPVRPSAQGLSDLVMGLAGASAGAVSGLVVSWSGYPTLNLLAAVATVPLVALALRPVRERVYA
ncbi:MAG: MFS transporter [Micromonosporaceae bacterium]|nr:MFS transporter [Micromonosporaceae bacterium]